MQNFLQVNKGEDFGEMIQLNEDDLLEIQMDLKGISNMLVVIEASEYYNKQDAGVFRGIRNSIDFTKSKLDALIQTAKETE